MKYLVKYCRYPASVTAVSIAGKFIVSFDGYQNEEEVSNGEIKQLESSNTSLTDGYQGLAAPKRHKVQDEGSLEEMPSWLEIKPTGISYCIGLKQT